MNFLEAKDILRMSDEQVVASGELNNFSAWLPDGDGSTYLRYAEWGGLLDITVGDGLLSRDEGVDGYSDLYLSKTPREFSNLILQFISESNIDYDEMLKIMIARREMHTRYNELAYLNLNPDIDFESEMATIIEKSSALLKQVYLLTMPVVRRLLKEGFVMKDFTS